MENPEKIEIEGLKTIHKLCKFGAEHNMEGCSFTEIVERMFDELESAKAQAVPEISASIAVHQIIIDEIKTEIDEGYDLCQDSYLLDVLVERGIEIGKIQAVPEGFVLVLKEPTPKMIDATWDFDDEIQEMSHNTRNEFIYKAMIEAQEPTND